MRRKTTWTAVLLLLAAVAGAQEWRQGKGRIEGTVKNSKGEPIADATVSLKFDELGRGPDLKTDKKGYFALMGLNGGKWDVDVSAPGYQPFKTFVNVTELQRVPPMNMVLEPEVKQEAAKPEISVGGEDQQGNRGRDRAGKRRLGRRRKGPERPGGVCRRQGVRRRREEEAPGDPHFRDGGLRKDPGRASGQRFDPVEARGRKPVARKVRRRAEVRASDRREGPREPDDVADDRADRSPEREIRRGEGSSVPRSRRRESRIPRLT